MHDDPSSVPGLSPLVHTLHAGVYTRTVRLLAGHSLLGAVVRIPTTLILSGDIVLHNDDGVMQFIGYHVLPAYAGRQSRMYARADTTITAIHATQATTVEEAEREAVGDVALLRSPHDQQLLTGVPLCLTQCYGPQVPYSPAPP